MQSVTLLFDLKKIFFSQSKKKNASLPFDEIPKVQTDAVVPRDITLLIKCNLYSFPCDTDQNKDEAKKF